MAQQYLKLRFEFILLVYPTVKLDIRENVNPKKEEKFIQQLLRNNTFTEKAEPFVNKLSSSLKVIISFNLSEMH